MLKFLILSSTLLLATNTIDANFRQYRPGVATTGGANQLYKPGVVKDLYTTGGANQLYKPGVVKEIFIGPGAARPVVKPGANHHIATAKIGLSGKYHIKECFDGKKIVSSPSWFKFTLEVTAHAVEKHRTYIGYKLIYTVGNKLWTHMTQVRDGSWVMHNDGQTQHQMKLDSDEAKAERFVLNFEKWFTHFKVNADVVTFYGKNGSRMVLVRAHAQRPIH